MASRDRTLPGAIRVAMGGSALAAAFVAGVATAGGFTATTPPVVDDPVVPVAGKDALRQFADCRDLLGWYVEENVGDVGPYGWEMPPFTALSERLSGSLDGPTPLRDFAAAAGADSADSGGYAAQLNSETGTNVQEVGVDEPDVAKTDGRLLVHLVDHRRLVVTDVSGSSPRELGTFTLPEKLFGQDLLLVDDHVLVTTSTPMPVDLPTDTWRDEGFRFVPGRQVSQVLDLDISEPAEPTLVGTDSYSGQIVSVRQHGDVVRVVTSTLRPELDWVEPRGDVSEREAVRRNRELVRDSTLEDWLPSVTDDDGRTTTPACEEVFRPRDGGGGGTVAIFGQDVDEPDERDVVAVTTDSHVVYSSTDRVYVATTDLRDGFWRSAYTGVTGQRIAPAPEDVTTQLHSFALDGVDASYVASGHVTGTVRDRWSLDEQDGRLRVAVSLPGRWGGAVENGVAVLVEDDGRLDEVGYVGGLGPDEDIKSVRWFDDFAVVVTFRQTDPLYTIDFSDPEDPVALGELKILGFSGYLHPIGGGLLLGLGQDATEQGQLRGAQAAVFDISDLTDPRRVALHTFGEATDLAAMTDPRAFTWLPGSAPGTGTAVTTLHDWRRGGSVPLTLRVAGGRLDADRLEEHAGGSRAQRALPLDGDRVALVGEDVAIVEIG